MKLQSKVEIKIVGKSINVHLFSNATLNNYNLSLCVTHLALKKKVIMLKQPDAFKMKL